MKIFDKFPSTASNYKEGLFDRSRKSPTVEEVKRDKNQDSGGLLTSLNEATLYFSRHQSKEKVNGAEEAFKLLNEMTRYLENTIIDGNAVELVKDMTFDTKKLSLILSS